MAGINLADLFAATATEEAAVDFAVVHGLLPRRDGIRCRRCRRPQSVRWVSNHRAEPQAIPWILRCSISTCRKQHPLTDGTWFHHSHVAVSVSFRLIYCWIMGLAVQHAAAECRVSGSTVVDYYQFCREVAYVHVSHNSSPIGGPGHVVELDDSQIFTWKYKRDRTTGFERRQQWVFGGIDRETKECFVVEVNRRDADTLVPIVEQFVRPGTKVITNHWNSYRQLSRQGFEHRFINHSIEFVSADDPAIHTQTIKRLWRSVKRVCRAEGRPTKRLDLYLFQFLYFHKLKVRDNLTTNPEKFQQFLNDLAMVYPGQYADQPLQPRNH